MQTPDFSTPDAATQTIANAMAGKRIDHRTATVVVWMMEKMMEALDHANAKVPEAAVELNEDTSRAVFAAVTLAAIGRDEEKQTPTDLLLNVGRMMTDPEYDTFERRTETTKAAYANIVAGLNVEDDTDKLGIFYHLRQVVREDEARDAVERVMEAAGKDEGVA